MNNENTESVSVVRTATGLTPAQARLAGSGKLNRITDEAFMKRIGVSLDKVASAVLTALNGGVPTEITAISVTPNGIEMLK